MTALQPGQMLGQYQITSQIGKGGMATVYKAYQASMDRYVALKVVSGQVMDDPNFLQRFTQEARLIAKLEHPHILPVHDFGEADGTPYMVMRFLEAGTLTERLALGQLPLPEVDRIFSQLTDALGYAHEHGVIHRDIKPSNAMLDKRGDVFLTDFGIAKMVEGSPGLTATGAITGTPSYMSPEQAQGNKVDQRSDIYSLGIVLFEMLTGRVPFEAETPMAVLFKQILDPPPPLSTVRPDLPYTLEMVLLRALSKKAEDRYATMDAFRTAWKNALAEAADAPPAAVTQKPVPVTAPVKPITVETVPQNAPAKKGPNWALLAGGIFAGLVVCFGLAAFLFTGGYLGAKQALTAATATVQTPDIGIPVDDQPAAVAKRETQSWAGANSVYSIAFRGDEVLTSGFGGITVWKPDGTQAQITTADGLPSANSSAVFVDTDGSLWVGSSNAGITHLVANQATTYTSEQGLDNNFVFFITRSGERLLAATQYGGVDGGGLLAFDGNRWQPLTGFPSKLVFDEKSVSTNVRQAVTDVQGNLWVATDSGLAMLDGDQKWHVFKTAAGLPDDSVQTVYVDAAGGVWVGTSNSSVVKFNPSKQAFESFADLNQYGLYEVYSILEDKTGAIWFVGDRLVRYTPGTKEWKIFMADDGSLPIAAIHSARMNGQGVLYFGSEEHGLLRYAGEKFEKLQVLDAPHYGQYGRIVPAPDGKLIFLEREGNDAETFDPAHESWTKLPQDRHSPLVFDVKGRLWSGSYDGLWIFDADKTIHITKAHGLPSEAINAIALNPDGTAYLATSEGVALFDGEKVKEVYTFAENGVLSSNNALTLLLASDGSLWVGLTGGFSHRLPDGSWKHFTSDKLFGGYTADFSGFVEDRDGNIWITTLGDGLYEFPKNGEPKRMLATDPGVDLPSDRLTSLALASDGSLWIGSDGQGAVRYDVKSKTWKRYGLKEGLMQLNVNAIYAEAGGAIWFTTNGGITRLVP